MSDPNRSNDRPWWAWLLMGLVPFDLGDFRIRNLKLPEQFLPDKRSRW